MSNPSINKRQADSRADDPRILRARIAELERELAKNLQAAELTQGRESAIRKEAARSVYESYLEPLREAALALGTIRAGAERLFHALEQAHHMAQFHDVITEPAQPALPQPLPKVTRGKRTRP